MAYIPADKMKILREAAMKGDARAKSIIQKHFKKQDYQSEYDEYFSNAEEPATREIVEEASGEAPVKEAVATKGTGNPQLDEWLESNGIHEGDPDYEEALEEYYGEYPDQRPAEEPASANPGSAVEQSLYINTGMGMEADTCEEVDLTKEIAQGIIDLVGKCDKTLLAMMSNEEIDDTARKGAMTSLQEIKQSLFDAAEKVRKIKHSLCKKEEETLL